MCIRTNLRSIKWPASEWDSSMWNPARWCGLRITRLIRRNPRLGKRTNSSGTKKPPFSLTICLGAEALTLGELDGEEEAAVRRGKSEEPAGKPALRIRPRVGMAA